MADRIKAVLFDLGETLVSFGKIDVFNVFREAAGLSHEYFRKMDQPVENFRSYLWKNLLGIRMKLFVSDLTGNDFDSLEVLKKSGRRRGIQLSDQQWEEVSWSWYKPLSQRATFEPNLGETLKSLKDSGLILGIVSNTFVNGCSLDRHLAMQGLLDYFDIRIYSYNYNFRKPDKRIFDLAAEQINTEPANTIFVGDRIDNDVKGALKAGMIPVLKTAYTNKNKSIPKGTARIGNISQLPELIKMLNAK